MGLYDYVRVNYPLPDEHNKLVFQTKDLGQLLGTYEITKDGELFLVISPLPGFIGIQGTNLNYSRELTIYDYTVDKRWIEYNLIFENGIVVDVKRVYRTI